MRSAAAGSLRVWDDAAVIERSRRDASCFATLFDRHAPRIHRYIARRAGQQIADDLLAETFLVAFAKRHRYDAGFRDAGPWLYGIATKLVAQHRRDERRRLRSAPPLDRSTADHADRVVADLTAESLRVALSDAIEELPEGDRDVLLLVGREQLTYDDVARALEIPVGTVRSRMHRARAALRRALHDAEQADTYEEILSNE